MGQSSGYTQRQSAESEPQEDVHKGKRNLKASRKVLDIIKSDVFFKNALQTVSVPKWQTLG